jgi:uncharacterized membrane protein
LQHPHKISNIAIVKKIKDFFQKYFITGLLVLIPLWATFYVLTGLLGMIDNILGDVPTYIIGFRIPGMGIITLIGVILTVGILSANYFGTQFIRYSDELMQRVPLVRGIYTTVKQIMETFSVKHNFRGVVLIEYPRKGCYSLGFMTGEMEGRKLGLSGVFVSVFVPTTPNPTAGFLLLLPKEEVTHLDMTVDEGMKFIISLGLVSFTEIEAAKLKQGQREVGA